MRLRMTTICLLTLLVAVCTPTVYGQADRVSRDEFRKLKEQLLTIQRQMGEMQKQHAAEVQALRQEVQALREGQPPAATTAATEADELAELRRMATAAVAEQEKPETKQEIVFKAGGLSLQALNPEISLTGDFIGLVKDQDGTRKRSDFNFRCLGLHFESYLDPYTRFKAAVPVTEGKASIGEAYMTRYGVLPNVNLTIGKFRQQFGVINRWHEHGLDQVNFPLALKQIFGPGGLNQTGVSADWTMPMLWGASQELTLQITNGENGRLFGSNKLSTPCTLLHYKNYRDLSENTYCELGLTGLLGWSDEWTLGGVTKHDSLSTRVFGLDFAVLWEPTDRMRYRNVEWRTELYWLNREILAPDASGNDTINAWGAYSYLQSRLNRTWDVGLRLDYYKPDDKDYAGNALAPLAYADDEAYRWQVGPYLTWWQSPFVKYRLEYNYVGGDGMEEPQNILMLQAIFAAGPHKHERY